VFENGAEELHLAKDISGVPAFGRWVTALTAGGPVIDQDPEEDVGSGTIPAGSSPVRLERYSR
jgi:hypothetical protein